MLSGSVFEYSFCSHLTDAVEKDLAWASPLAGQTHATPDQWIMPFSISKSMIHYDFEVVTDLDQREPPISSLLGTTKLVLCTSNNTLRHHEEPKGGFPGFVPLLCVGHDCVPCSLARGGTKYWFLIGGALTIHTWGAMLPDISVG
ncbi:hypothetical protein QVD17_00265 [Tagetes erecta]|uniref:Uncharacterized protein n=1 Tax=Tagetes erecta TaxID=13708 RepID=A0AAD8P0F6_TARER|nr:hypothetical protein QVD17_00265 [Tagetes erecta]